MTEDRFDKLMRDAAETFRRPPEPPLDEMWAEIESRAGLRATPSVDAVTPIADARRGFGVPSWIGIAATLVIGIAIGRGSTSIGHDVLPAAPQVVASTEAPAAPTHVDPALGRPYEVETSQYLGQTA